ncbi:hypothetical protein C7S20_15885 [Christiangramia fulva]|uniref:Uncharacterized protein n=1 Tax=Christiangramia fulva TaxID=2126553 RepID=A0A2R3Z8M8_9FLAO|nr:hypothetical protein C7S20_15885 [Christiangramia fulva]
MQNQLQFTLIFSPKKNLLLLLNRSLTSSRDGNDLLNIAAALPVLILVDIAPGLNNIPLKRKF